MSQLKSLLGLCLAAIMFAACESGTSQVSGVVGQLNFNTFACQPKDQIVTIRNDNMNEPQRVQGLMFELGTNDKNFYKIKQVSMGGSNYKTNGKIANEIIMPPGATMQVTLSYNPRQVTIGSDAHVSYLDVVLNGPKLGIMQIKLSGRATASLPNCGGGDTTAFEVTGITTYLMHKTKLGNNQVKTELDVSQSVKGDFAFGLDEAEGMASIDEQGWPQIDLPLPEGQALPSLAVNLDAGTYENGTFDGSALAINDLSLDITVGSIGGVLLTTGEASVSNSEGNISLTGSPLDDNGNMVLVLAVAIKESDAPLVAQNGLGDAVFGAEIRLHKK